MPEFRRTTTRRRSSAGPPLNAGVPVNCRLELNFNIPLPPPRGRQLSHQDNELTDTTSSTHPSHTGRQPRIPPDIPEDMARPHIAELPRKCVNGHPRSAEREVPNPLKPNTGNQDQYCHFHHSCRHTNEACKQLKDEIKRVIHQGYLQRFIREPPAREEAHPTGGGKSTTTEITVK
ncbi:hypothetical protein M5K25_000635 [Dendrobium thyrsiflorum]|uniref:Reverse transcriptase domain-containing protein n=1 Tax=Dendrobium thyrsiflorum TaxID=117978 RepID=A0ABD0VUF3_DENTH